MNDLIGEDTPEASVTAFLDSLRKAESPDDISHLLYSATSSQKGEANAYSNCIDATERIVQKHMEISLFRTQQSYMPLEVEFIDTRRLGDNRVVLTAATRVHPEAVCDMKRWGADQLLVKFVVSSQVGQWKIKESYLQFADSTGRIVQELGCDPEMPPGRRQKNCVVNAEHRLKQLDVSSANCTAVQSEAFSKTSEHAVVRGTNFDEVDLCDRNGFGAETPEQALELFLERVAAAKSIEDIANFQMAQPPSSIAISNLMRSSAEILKEFVPMKVAILARETSGNQMIFCVQGTAFGQYLALEMEKPGAFVQGKVMVVEMDSTWFVTDHFWTRVESDGTSMQYGITDGRRTDEEPKFDHF